MCSALLAFSAAMRWAIVSLPGGVASALFSCDDVAFSVGAGVGSTAGRGGGGGGWVVLVLLVLLFEPANADVDFCGGGGGGGDSAVNTDAGMEKRRDAPTGGGGGGGVVPTATAELASLGGPLRSAARRSATEEVGAVASTSIEPYGRELRRAGGGGGGGGWPPVLLAFSLAILSAMEIF